MTPKPKRPRIKRAPSGAIPLKASGGKRPHRVREYGRAGLETTIDRDPMREERQSVRIGRHLYALARVLDLRPDELPVLMGLLNAQRSSLDPRGYRATTAIATHKYAQNQTGRRVSQGIQCRHGNDRREGQAAAGEARLDARATRQAGQGRARRHRASGNQPEVTPAEAANPPTAREGLRDTRGRTTAVSETGRGHDERLTRSTVRKHVVTCGRSRL